MAEFTWKIGRDSSKQVEMRVNYVSFGNGYSQRSGDGINPGVVDWDVVIPDLNLTTAAAIDTFLTTHAGVLAFDWQPPGGTMKKWTCKSWSFKPGPGALQSFSGKFHKEPL